jgi:hypothetical protein
LGGNGIQPYFVDNKLVSTITKIIMERLEAQKLSDYEVQKRIASSSPNPEEALKTLMAPYIKVSQKYIADSAQSIVINMEYTWVSSPSVRHCQ